MKKILVTVLIMAMGATFLIGCGGSGSNDSGTGKETDVVQESANDEVDKSDESDYVEESEEDSSELTWDTFFEVNSISGTKVKVYYDPNVIASSYTLWEPEFSVTDTEGNTYDFAVVDCDTAEKFLEWRINNFTTIQSKTNGEFSELEEHGIVGENMVKKYNLEYDQISTDDNNNAVYTPISYSECVIELGSAVVCFDNTEEQKFWDVLAAMKFVIE